MIHLVRLSEGKEFPRFQHFRSTKTSNKFLNAWEKTTSAETLLDANMWLHVGLANRSHNANRSLHFDI